MNFKAGLVLGMGSVVNLFIAFMDREFSVIWISLSIILLAATDAWLLQKEITDSKEKKELYWAKHGVWSVGLLALLFGLLRHGELTTYYLLSALLVMAVIAVQCSLYNYKLQKAIRS